MIVILVILYATINDNPLDDTQLPPIPHLDKLIHATMFGGLLGALTFDRHRAGLRIDRKALLPVAIACVIGGAFDEIAQQYLTSARAGDIIDLAADFIGITVAYYTAPPAVRRVLRKD